jgi:putative ABC transport system ATP-binding protein
MTATIVMNDVCKVYRSGELDFRALDGVTLTIESGELVAIMGASGSGKSTLMNILGCLDHPSTGTYSLAGKEVSGMGRNDLAEVRNQFLGFVFQSFNLLSRTSAIENVELPLVYAGIGKRERNERAARALERVGLGDRLQHFPSQLSGGQQQRVAIARSIVNDPKVLLADEPTGNLDSKTSEAVMVLFQDLWRAGLTIVYVTHEPDVANCASRIITLRDGRIISDRRQQARLASVQPKAA